MADQDPKARTGSEHLAPATQSVHEREADISNAGHHARVQARIQRGHGKDLHDHPNVAPFNPKE